MRKNKVRSKFKRLLTLSIIAFFSSIPFTMAQDEPTPDWQKRAVDWMQGGSITEDWFMKDFLGGYKTIVWGEFGVFIDMATVLGGLFAIIYFSIKGYEMMTGDKKIDIIPLLRPFGLCLILTFWKPFITVVSVPTDLIANVASAKYEAQQRSITQLRYDRANVQHKIINKLYERKAEIDTQQEESEYWIVRQGSKIKEAVKGMLPALLEMKDRLGFQIQLFITQVLETAALWVLRIAVYGLFLIQIVFSGVLIMFGPFSVAMSIHPAFKDSFLTWISRFISVNLYLGIGYIVLFICGILQKFALESEIRKFKDMIVGGEIDMGKYMYMHTNGVMSFGTVIISFLLSAIAIMSVPSISTWIVSTSGVTSAVATSSRAGQIIGSKMGGAVASMFKK